MTIREADILQVVVLAPGAHTLLRGCGPRVVALFGAQEDVLELVHSRVGKEQGRVIGGEQRGAVHLAVSPLDKKVQEHASNVVSGMHTGRFQ